MTNIFSAIHDILDNKPLSKADVESATSTEVNVHLNTDGYLVSKTPYSKSFVNDMHQIPGTHWDYDTRSWYIPMKYKEDLRSALIKSYGTATRQSTVKIITVELKDYIDADNEQSTIYFHGKPLLWYEEGCETASLDMDTSLFISDIDKETNADEINEKITVNKGFKMCFGAYASEFELHDLGKDDDTWKVVDVKDINPITEEDEERFKLQDLDNLLQDRRELLSKLHNLNEKLSDFGIQMSELYKNPAKKIYDADAHMAFYDSFKKQTEEKRRAQDEAKQQDEMIIKEAKKNAKKYELKEFRDISFTSDDIEAVTQKAVLINLNDDQSFWYPKSLLTDKAYYFNTSIPEDFDLTDDNDEKIDLKELHAKFGDEKKISKYAHDNDLGTNLTEFHHRPKHIEAKEVEVDDSLKR